MKVRALNSSGASEGGLKSSFIRSLATANPVNPPVTVVDISQQRLRNRWASVSTGCATGGDQSAQAVWYPQEPSMPVHEMPSHQRAHLAMATMKGSCACRGKCFL